MSKYRTYLRSFPVDWPHINSMNQTIEKSEVVEAATFIINNPKIDSVAGTRLLLWCLNVFDGSGSFASFAQFMVHKYRDRLHMSVPSMPAVPLSDNIIDEKSLEESDVKDLKISYHKLFSDVSTLDALMAMRPYERARKMAQIKKVIDNMSEEDRIETGYANLGKGMRDEPD